MRKQSIDEKMLIEAGKNILKKEGITAINMRSIAQYSNVSLGSIYNYYKDKDELLLGVVKSIWLEIAQGRNDESDSFKGMVSALYDSIEEGNRIYPDFLKIHFTSFTNRKESRQAMDEIIENIKDSLLEALNEDKDVISIFNDGFNKRDFVNFIFENVMTLLLRNEGKDYLLKIIDKLLYEN
ncbi:MAG: TetR/AcrR family transcriptional regulator [Erysipelotrichaceae bacterium]